MGEEKTFTTSAATYPRYVGTFRALKGRIGRSLQLYDPDDVPCEVGIFVFDHFTGFEIINRDDAPTFDNHSITQQALREWRPLIAEVMDLLPVRSAVPLLQWSGSEGTA